MALIKYTKTVLPIQLRTRHYWEGPNCCKHGPSCFRKHELHERRECAHGPTAFRCNIEF
jgi:hypothetical protein